MAIYDVDTAPDRTLTLDLSCSKGVLTFKSVTGLEFLRGDGFQDSSLTFSGTLDALNTAMVHLSYAAHPQVHGWDSIKISITDEPLQCSTNMTRAYGMTGA